MSSRRKSDENPVTLFSFQDIITSISGILILLVLLFAIDVAQQKFVDPAKEPSATSQDPVHTNRLADIEELKKYLWALKSGQLEKIRAAQLVQSKTSLQVKYETLSEVLAQLHRDNKRVSDGLKGDTDVLAILKRELDLKKKRIHWVVGDREPIFVECSGTEVLCGALGEQPKKYMPQQRDAFLQQAAGYDRTKHSFVFLIKPSSVAYVMAWVRILKGSSASVGWEPYLESEKFFGD